MLDLLLELFANRLGVFILGVALVIGGIYGWKEFRHESALYDVAVGKNGRKVEAKVVWKNTEMSSSDSYRDDGGYSQVGYLNLEFETENGNQRIKVYVGSDEYDRVKEGELLQIKYHPDNPEYVVTPKAQRPSVLLATLGFGFCVVLGALLCLAIIISLF